MSSRAGDVLGKLGYGSLLGRVADWGHAARLAAGLSVGAAALGGGAHRDSPTARDVRGVVPSVSDLGRVVWRIVSSGAFWRAALAMGSTCVIKRTLEVTIATYLYEAAAPDISSQGAAAQLASAWPAGILVSVVGGGFAFRRLGSRGKLALTAALMCLTMGGCTALACLSTSVATSPQALALRVALVFVTALGIGLPYYVPVGLFAVSFGGSSSGVVSAYLDVVAFAASAAFLARLRPILDASANIVSAASAASAAAAASDTAGWATMWWALAAMSALMFVANLSFLRELLATLDAKPPARPE